MSLVNNIGTYRGYPSDTGMSTTKNGFPQFIISLTAREYWDTAEQEWIDITDRDEQILAYLVLFGGDGKATLTAKQIQKIFGWSGQSFKDLNDGDYSEVGVQFRVEENEYEGTTTLQVNWVDVYDATPGRQVNKLDADDLTKLDKLFSKNLKGFGGTKVASAPATSKPAPPKIQQPELPVETNDPPELVMNNGVVEESVTECTKSEAWRYLVTLKEDNSPDLTDEEFTALWQDAIQEAAPKARSNKQVTSSQWFAVREAVTKQIIGF